MSQLFHQLEYLVFVPFQMRFLDRQLGLLYLVDDISILDGIYFTDHQLIQFILLLFQFAVLAMVFAQLILLAYQVGGQTAYVRSGMGKEVTVGNESSFLHFSAASSSMLLKIGV